MIRTIIRRGLLAVAATATAFVTMIAGAQPATVRPAATDDLRSLQATAQDVSEGQRLAQDACARCHGPNGVSSTAGIPHIAGQRAPYTHLQLRAYKEGRRPQSPMTGAVKFLSEEALVKVSAYYASLDPAPRAQAKAAPPRPDPLQAGKAAAEACSGCHGDNGVSTTPGMPSLVALDPRYFITAMRDYKSGKRKDETMKPFVEGLSDADIGNLALYYATQKPARAQTKAAGNAEAGKAPAATCAGCHGDGGVSSNPATPSLAGQDAEYLVTATRAYADGSRKDESMTAPAAALDDKALRDAAAYFAAQAPKPVSVRKPLALAEWVERCNRCHGPNGNSVDPVIPAIAAQRADWIERVLADYRTGARKSNAMSAMSASLGENDVKDLAAYYARQPARAVTYVIIPSK
jgi:cytochrome c553